MKIDEVMFGDIVSLVGNPIHVTLGVFNHWSNNIKPIPLTPEILEKNDILYEKQSYYYVIEDNKDLECTYYIQQVLQGDWAIGVDTGAYECSVFARIKYIHELQHALKLCGIDKEIVV